MQKTKSLLTITAVILSLQAVAQPKPSATWTNRISRILPVRDSSYLVPTYPADSMLAWKLVRMAQAGKIAAYKTFNSQLLEKLSIKDIGEMLHSRDSVEIEDPVTGEKATRVIKHDAGPSSIQRFRVLEEWTFDESAGTLVGKIVGIAPVSAVYGDNGDFRGNRSMMWFRYSDVGDIVYGFGKRHKDAALSAIEAKAILNFPFQWPGTSAQPWYLNVMMGDTAYDSKSITRSEVQYPGLTQYMAEQAVAGKLKTWKDAGSSLQPQAIDELKRSIVPKADTVDLEDPVTDVRFKRVVRRDMDYDAVHDFLLKGVWTVDEKAGTYSFSINAITPELNLDRDETGHVPGILIKYTDALPILKLYEQRNPKYSLALAVWNCMFK